MLGAINSPGNTTDFQGPGKGALAVSFPENKNNLRHQRQEGGGEGFWSQLLIWSQQTGWEEMGN